MGIDIQIESAGWLYGINDTFDMSFGEVFFMYMCVEVDAFFIIIPCSINVQITQQGIVQLEITDEKACVQSWFL